MKERKVRLIRAFDAVVVDGKITIHNLSSGGEKKEEVINIPSGANAGDILKEAGYTVIPE